MAIVSGIFIVVLMLLTVSDMTLRKFFSSGVPGAVEINEVVLVAIVFLALTSAEMTDTNVRTPLVTERLPNTGTKGQAFRDEWKTALKAMDTKYSSYVDPTTTCAERF